MFVVRVFVSFVCVSLISDPCSWFGSSFSLCVGVSCLVSAGCHCECAVFFCVCVFCVSVPQNVEEIQIAPMPMTALFVMFVVVSMSFPFVICFVILLVMLRGLVWFFL